MAVFRSQNSTGNNEQWSHSKSAGARLHRQWAYPYHELYSGPMSEQNIPLRGPITDIDAVMVTACIFLK